MPRRAGIDDSAAGVPNILQFHVDGFCPLSFRSADTVLQVYDVVGDDDVGVLAGQAAADAYTE